MGTAPETFWAEIFSTGTWTDSAGQKDTWTERDLDQMVEAFRATSDKHKPPLRVGAHPADIAPAGGWVEDLRRDGGKLLARFSNMPRIVREAIDGKLFRQVSAGIDFNREIGGKTWPRLLNHVALLGGRLPAVKGLQDLQAYLASEKPTEAVHLEPLATTRGFTRTAADDNPLIFSKEEDPMSDQALTVLQDQIKAMQTEFASLKAVNEQLAKDKRELSEKVEAGEKKQKEFEASTIKAAQERSLAAAKSYCDEKVKAGVMVPAAVEKLLAGAAYSEKGDLLIGFESVREFAEKGIAKLPKGEQGLHGEGEKSKDETADVRWANAVIATQAKAGVGYEEASRRTKAEQPKLYAEYQEFLGGKEVS